MGFDAPNPIKKGLPTLDELQAFFKSKPEWIFFAGHFGDFELSNEDGSVTVAFAADGVVLSVGGGTIQLKKGTEEFSLDAKCEVVLWGGCSVCSSDATIRTLRALFGPHVLLGFRGTTSWEMVDAMLGGGFIGAGKHFFDRVVGRDSDALGVRDAWMQTAKLGYAGTKAEPKFRAIDPDGREWRLLKGDIKPGRSFT